MTKPVVICGAGIGGLTAGIALRQRGFAVRILERVARIEPVGAGITVQVNAMRVMQRLGSAEAIAAAGALVTRGSIRSVDGRTIRSMVQADLAERYGAPFVAIHRARLHDVLLKAFDGELATGTAVARVITRDDGATVKLVGDAVHEAALVVGADGLRSAVRESLLGAQPPRAAEQISWRCVCPRTAAASDPGGETWGRGARFGFVPIGGDAIYWYAVMDKATAP